MSKILFTHRDGVRYVEHCRVVANDKHVSFIMADDVSEKFFNIPHANLACLLLGPGTSLTQSAVHKLSEQGVLVGWTGGGGAPLFMASQNEYRPTEYFQAWVKLWGLPAKRLEMAKAMQIMRCDLIEKRWRSLSGQVADGLFNLRDVETAVQTYRKNITLATKNEQLMGYEANLVKAMYKVCAGPTGLTFSRDPMSEDPLNQFITTGNYMAYGLAATALWILGIPHAMPVSHRQTRRGALVFDLADVIKDAFVLPAAMVSACSYEKPAIFRSRLSDSFHQHEALRILIETIKGLCK